MLPRASLAHIVPATSGSSEKYSKLRPPQGERCIFALGAYHPFMPIARASFASEPPVSYARYQFHVAAISVAHGYVTAAPTSKPIIAGYMPLPPSMSIHSGFPISSIAIV